MSGEDSLGFLVNKERKNVEKRGCGEILLDV